MQSDSGLLILFLNIEIIKFELKLFKTGVELLILEIIKHIINFQYFITQ